MLRCHALVLPLVRSTSGRILECYLIAAVLHVCQTDAYYMRRAGSVFDSTGLQETNLAAQIISTRSMSHHFVSPAKS
uniref:Uncharacterized protein n=1 Tax=Anguilla anguilla TaxID=7936 RepID=A0A0E9WWW5_ANGAN